MIFVFNRRAYGRVSVVDGTFVVTHFWCFNFLPILPRESHVVLARAPNGECTSVPIPAHAPSIAAGYARAWAVMGAVASLFVVAAADDAGERLRALAALGVAAVVCAIAWLVVGRVGDEERARRRAYGEVTGAPVDPAWLPEERRRELSVRLRADLGARAPALARAQYREAPETAWAKVAADPAVTEPDFLQRALVLARLEWRDAGGAERAQLERAGDELWRKWRASASA